MKKAIKITVLTTFVLASCSKDVEVCVDGDMSPDKPGSYTYTWCGTNEEHVEWNPSWENATYSGESVTFDFDTKGVYGFNVEGIGKKDHNNGQEYFEIRVGEYKTRAELYKCGGSAIQASQYPNLRAYVYNDLSELQTDLRIGNFSGCIDSVNCTNSDYYDNGIQSTETLVAEFTGLPNGDYLIYIEEYGDNNNVDHNVNNIGELYYTAVAGYNTNITVKNGEYDDVVSFYVSTSANADGSTFIKNLFSKSFAITDIWIDGSNTGVPSCNSDDYMLFNINGTWEQNVGSDDCSGNQTTSLGTWVGMNECNTIQNGDIQMSCSSGSLSSAQSFYFEPLSTDMFKLTIYTGTNTVEQEYTAQ